MTTPEPSRLDRVRKLLAKAERAGTPDEAEIYTAKAVELMARHGIDDALLAARPGATADPIGATRYTIDDPYSAGKARLLGWTAAASGCRWVMHDASGGTVGAVSVFGHRSDRERVELLYTSLLLQIAGPLRSARPTDRRESVAAYRRSWLYGFAARIHARLQAAREDAERRSDVERGTGGGVASTALVLAGRGEAVDRAYAEHFGNLRRARRPSVSGTGYVEGMSAADRADLGGIGRLSGGRQALQK